MTIDRSVIETIAPTVVGDMNKMPYVLHLKHVKVTQRRVTSIDPIPASENNDHLVPTANCFMVAPGSAFCFDPCPAGWKVPERNSGNYVYMRFTGYTGGTDFVYIGFFFAYWNTTTASPFIGKGRDNVTGWDYFYIGTDWYQSDAHSVRCIQEHE